MIVIYIFQICTYNLMGNLCVTSKSYIDERAEVIHNEFQP